MTGLVVDPRAGSKTLIKPLRKLGVRVTPEQHEFGDVIFMGNGPQGPVQVGIEHKRIEDVLDCIRSGRFASHQLPGLIDCFGVVILLVQGRWKADAEGRLLVWKPNLRKRTSKWIIDVGAAKGRWVRPKGNPRRPWTYSAVEHWLHTMQFQGGIHVERQEDVKASARYLKALYSWWAVKEWDEHSSLKVFNESGAVPMTSPTIAAKVAKAVRGIGWDKAHAAARHFGSPQRLANACADDWCKIPGIDKVLARRAVRAMQQEGVR